VLRLNQSVAVVVSVEGEAARVGLKVGDVVYRVGGKRPLQHFPPTLHTTTPKDKAEAMFDDQGNEIGVVEITVLRLDIEQVRAWVGGRLADWLAGSLAGWLAWKLSSRWVAGWASGRNLVRATTCMHDARVVDDPPPTNSTSS
jgi:hypothetical protein